MTPDLKWAQGRWKEETHMIKMVTEFGNGWDEKIKKKGFKAETEQICGLYNIHVII